MVQKVHKCRLMDENLSESTRVLNVFIYNRFWCYTYISIYVKFSHVVSPVHFTITIVCPFLILRIRDTCPHFTLLVINQTTEIGKVKSRSCPSFFLSFYFVLFITSNYYSPCLYSLSVVATVHVSITHRSDRVVSAVFSLPPLEQVGLCIRMPLRTYVCFSPPVFVYSLL
jgi:hypothetical protein